MGESQLEPVLMRRRRQGCGPSSPESAKAEAVSQQEESVLDTAVQEQQQARGGQPASFDDLVEQERRLEFELDLGVDHGTRFHAALDTELPECPEDQGEPPGVCSAAISNDDGREIPVSARSVGLTNAHSVFLASQPSQLPLGPAQASQVQGQAASLGHTLDVSSVGGQTQQPIPWTSSFSARSVDSTRESQLLVTSAPPTHCQSPEVSLRHMLDVDVGGQMAQVTPRTTVAAVHQPEIRRYKPTGPGPSRDVRSLCNSLRDGIERKRLLLSQLQQV